MKSKHLTLPLSRFRTSDTVIDKSVPFARLAAMCLAVATLLLLSIGCTSAVRMQAKYDDEAQNAVPKNQPSPSPPHDFFSWGAIDVTARVVARSGGGNQVRVAPTPSYLNSGKYRAFILHAWSDALTTSKKPGVRGGVTVNMQGSGRMVVAIRAGQGANNLQGDPLGGYLFINVGIPSIGYMTTQNLKVMQLNPAVLNSTMLSSYTSGQPVELRWSIDQDSHLMSLGATPSGGSPQNASVTFQQVASDGTQNTPLEKIWLMIDMFEVPAGTQVFFDDFFVEEF